FSPILLSEVFNQFHYFESFVGTQRPSGARPLEAASNGEISNSEIGSFGWGGRIRTFTILINSEVSYRLDHAPAAAARLGGGTRAHYSLRGKIPAKYPHRIPRRVLLPSGPLRRVRGISGQLTP